MSNNQKKSYKQRIADLPKIVSDLEKMPSREVAAKWGFTNSNIMCNWLRYHGVHQGKGKGAGRKPRTEPFRVISARVSISLGRRIERELEESGMKLTKWLTKVLDNACPK